MTDDPDDPSDGLEDLTPDVSEERPLDSLVPELQKSGLPNDGEAHADAPTEPGTVHPRVLEVELEEGLEWTLAIWSDPGADGIRAELTNLLRASVLRELSRPPHAETRHFTAARVFAFDSIRRAARDVLRAFGWDEATYDPEAYSERLKAWQNEARAADRDPPARPVSIWELPVHHPPPDEQREADAMETAMIEELDGEVWGNTPGGPSKLLGRLLEAHRDIEVELGLAALETMAAEVAPSTEGAITGTRPVFFQALCDFVGVLLHAEHDVQVQWGVCRPDADGLVPPPTFRHPETGATLPVGRMMLDWSIMPSPEGSARPPLGRLVEHLADGGA